MEWKNLKENRCPDCGYGFGYESFTKRPGFIVCKCGFSISNKRFEEIVNSQVTHQIDEDFEARKHKRYGK